jgi:hypothetical protein
MDQGSGRRVIRRVNATISFETAAEAFESISR